MKLEIISNKAASAAFVFRFKYFISNICFASQMIL